MRLFDVLVGRGNHAHIRANRLRAAEPLEFARLEHAQQLDLRREVDLADLVEEQRAAFGQLEAALLGRVRARERAFLVAEQLRFDEGVRQRGTAHLDERPLRSQRVVVNGLGDELLAGARFAADQHGRVGARHLRHLLVDQAHRPARAKDVREVVALAQLALEVRVFLAKAIALGVDDALDADPLGHQRRHDTEEFHRPIEIALGLEAEIGAQRADGFAVEQNRHAHVTDFFARQLRAIGCPPQEHRLARNARHDDGLAALHDAARDAFAEPELRVGFAARRPFCRDDLDVACGRQQRDSAANHSCDGARECRAPDAARLSDSYRRRASG